MLHPEIDAEEQMWQDYDEDLYTEPPQQQRQEKQYTPDQLADATVPAPSQ